MTLTGSGGNATVDTGGGDITLTGILGGSGGLNKAGTGTLTLGGANNYSGDTSIVAGTLLLANSNALRNSTVNVLADNGLQFNPGIGMFNLGGLGGANALTLSDTAGGAVTLSVGGNNASTMFSGGLSGDGSLTKIGSGTLILSGSNYYTGGTFLSDGTLVLADASAIADGSSLTIGADGCLLFDPSQGLAPTACRQSLAAPAVRDFAPVPEPGTLTLLAIAATILGFGIRRKVWL